MPKQLTAVLLLASVLAPSVARADSWTGGQAEWARHGFQHGAWDCDGACPNGRGARSRPAPAKQRMTLACQHNIGDGRTLVSDGRVLPFGARFKVVSYRPNRTEDGWTYRICTIDVTR